MTNMTSSRTESCSSHGEGIFRRRSRTCRTALFLSLLNVLLSFTIAGPVFNKNFQLSHHIQAGRNIRHLPCKIKRSGEEGICMFAIDCLKSNGTHLGTCIDRFYFGSCCQLKDDREDILQPEINDNSIDGLLSGLVPASNTLSKLPNSNNYSNSNKTSNNNRATTSRTPVGGDVTTVFLTDEVTRKTTKRPVSSSAASSTTPQLSSSQKPTSSSSTTSHKSTTPAPSSSTNFEMISVSSGVLLNKKPTSSPSTTVFATLSTKLPTTVAASQSDKMSSSTGSASSTTSKRPSFNKPTSNKFPLPTSSAPVQMDKNDLDKTTTSVDLLEFTTFQSVNSEKTTTPATKTTTTTSTTRRPPIITAATRKPISVITKKPVKNPLLTTLKPTSPPRKTSATKVPLLQDPIFPQREPPVHNQIKSNGTTTKRPRPPQSSTRKPVTTLADDNLIQISISPPKATTKKPLPNKSSSTKKPLTTTTQLPKKKPTKPITVQKIPITFPTTTSTSTTMSPADETFTTISYVESTRAPRPKPTPTGNIEPVSHTGWEDLITVEEGDEEDELQVATNAPLMTIDEEKEAVQTRPNNEAVIGNSESSGGGEQRTTTQKPVKITSVKVEATTSTTTTSQSTAAPTTSSTPVTTSTSTITTTTTTTIKPTTPESTTTTTTTETPTTTSTISSSSSTVPSESSSAIAATTDSAKKPVLGEDTSEDEDSTTLAEGIVTWTNDLPDEEEKRPTTEAAATGEWVPLLTISTDDFKNASTPITSDDGTTTPMTPTPNDGNAETSEVNSTVPNEATSTMVSPTHVTDYSETEEENAATTIEPSIASNETTTFAPVDVFANTTAKPSFPSLEGVDYRMICGKRMFPEPRIVGGAMASFGRWPWQISLRQWRTSTYLHKCGAALLNENWAVTAAHCVDNVPPSDLLLRLGEFDLAEEDEPYGYLERRVQIVASHPQFDPRTFEYDLALLRFYEPVVFQPNIIPICVPETDEDFIGRTAFVTGWGRLYEDGPLPSKLQEVSVPVIENKICETMYRSAGYIEHIPNIFICAGWKKGGYDSCEGDSGGPMVIQRDDKRFQLAGVISWGIGCAEPDQPGVYTRISEFRVWINQILQF